jgi:hypothetical protein
VEKAEEKVVDDERICTFIGRLPATFLLTGHEKELFTFSRISVAGSGCLHRILIFSIPDPR